MFDLQGKTALVTGAGSGIGAAIATLFAQRGALVTVADRDAAAAARVAEEITAAGGVAAGHQCDVSQPESVEALFRAITAAHPRLDILVNNAGIAHVGTIEQTTPEDLDRIYRVNVVGVYLCARAAVPIMLSQGGGVILNMASIAALIGIPDRFAYSMSKGAVLTHDAIDRGRLHEARHPLQLHLPGPDPYAVRGRISSPPTIRDVKPR